ncbi:MAG TPA: hypothetical protein VGQ46_13150 [Thermoanaerobaculia bacterium]|jgi:hypothetical protein|nr:hypothetical protein [Thermoanaerobaculia bacterium]
MANATNAPLSAQVVVRGPRPSAGAAITAANVHEFTPDAATVSRLMSYFAGLGFETGAAVATSFSITAPASTFKRVFGTAKNSGDLPLASLDRNIAALLEAVTFPRPPDFGPTSY